MFSRVCESSPHGLGCAEDQIPDRIQKVPGQAVQEILLLLGRRFGPWSHCSWDLLDSASRSQTLPPAPPAPLPRVSLAVAPLYVAGSKPRRPRVCLTSMLTLCSGTAAVPLSAEPRSVVAGRAPGINPAAALFPQARPSSGSSPRVPLWPCAQAGPAAAATGAPGAGPAAISAQHAGVGWGRQRAAVQ